MIAGLAIDWDPHDYPCPQEKPVSNMAVCGRADRALLVSP